MIRLATINDLPFIMEIVNDAKASLKQLGTKQWNSSDGYPTSEIFLKDIEESQLYVFEDSSILGMIACIKGSEPNYQTIDGQWVSNGIDYLTIHRLAVKKEYYKKGIAKALILYAKELALKMKCSAIRIDTHPLNFPMQNLILSQRFSYCGKIQLPQQEDTLRYAYEFIL